MKGVLFGSFFLLTLLMSAQQDYDSLYIKRIDDKLSLKFFLENVSESFTYENESNNSKYEIKPNTIIKTAVAVHYKFISFRVAYAPKAFSNPDQDEKGRTKIFNFDFSLYYKQWIQNFSYANIKGFHGEVISGDLPDGSITTRLPDMRNVAFRGVTRYNFNKNYSFKALTSQNEVQRKSAGSFIPSVDYTYNILTDGQDDQDINSFNINLNAGCFYTLVLKKRMYLAGGLSSGFGIEFNKVSSNQGTQKGQESVFNIEGYLGGGYNSETWFGGLYLNSAHMFRDQDASIVEFNTNRSVAQLFIGYRFNAPKVLKKIKVLEK